MSCVAEVWDVNREATVLSSIGLRGKSAVIVGVGIGKIDLRKPRSSEYFMNPFLGGKRQVVGAASYESSSKVSNQLFYTTPLLVRSTIHTKAQARSS